MMGDPLLAVRNLKVHFPIRQGLLAKTVGYVYAVDGVSFDLRREETLGLVGESGCGKTTTGRGVLRLIEPTSGQIFFEGKAILGFRPPELKSFRCKAQLDVSVQAQVINLFRKLQEEFSLSYVIIAHNLSVVRHISDRIAVMYLGKIVELASSDGLHEEPLHPYSQALLSSIPIPNPHSKRKRILLEGDVPSSIHPPAHCKFHTRCPRRFEPCDQTDPVLHEVAPHHFVACHLYSAAAGRS
jgi:oligopeptide/dipeptide ABC transporter ATP-binding protein